MAYGSNGTGSAPPARRAPAKKLSAEEQVTQLHKWAREDLNRWQERNTRFQRDQDLYLLKKPDGVNTRLQSNLRILNDPKVLIKKVARLIARHPPVIEIEPRPGVDPTVAQKLENFLYFWDQAQTQKWVMGLQNPYRYDQAAWVGLRGWICERTMLAPDSYDDEGYGGTFQQSGDPSDLFYNCLIDPANVYPKVSGDAISRVTHAYTTDLGELRADPLFDLKGTGLEDSEDETTINCRAIYWRDLHDGGWYHAVILGQGAVADSGGSSMLVKKPTELGYNPWTISLANGASFRQTPWDDLEYLKEIGTGLLDESIDTFKYMNQMATQLQELLALEANPAVSLFSGTGMPRQIRFGPGERNTFGEKDRLDLHKVGVQMGDFQPLWDLLNQRASRAGLPPAFYAEYGGESGFSAAIMMAAGRDILFPFTEAVNHADAMRYRKVLEIYRDFGPPVPLPSKMQPQAGIGQILSGMGEVQSAEITPNEIAAQGTYVTISREDMTPQELATRINLALSMVREKAISLETARKDWIKLRNPQGENMKVLAEQVYLSPEVIQMLVPMALSGTGQEYLQRVWEMTQTMMPPGGGMAPPGMPPGAGGGGQPGPEGAAPQPPASAVPPITQGNLQTNSQVAQGSPELSVFNQMLQQMQGGATGGSGGGGLPPRPGSTGPVPRFLPPGRQ